MDYGLAVCVRWNSRAFSIQQRTRLVVSPPFVSWTTAAVETGRLSLGREEAPLCHATAACGVFEQLAAWLVWRLIALPLRLLGDPLGEGKPPLLRGGPLPAAAANGGTTVPTIHSTAQNKRSPSSTATPLCSASSCVNSIVASDGGRAGASCDDVVRIALLPFVLKRPAGLEVSAISFGRTACAGGFAATVTRCSLCVCVRSILVSHRTCHGRLLACPCA